MLYYNYSGYNLTSQGGKQMDEKTIKSISPVPLGLIMGTISGILGLIATIIFLLKISNLRSY